MSRMDKEERKAKRKGWPCYLVCLLILAGVFSLLLPQLQTKTAGGDIVFLDSWLLYFGGLQRGEAGGMPFSFSFNFNYFFLFVILLSFVSNLAVLFGRNTPSNLMTGMVLLVIVTVCLPFSPWLCAWTNGSIPAGRLVVWIRLFPLGNPFSLSFLLLIPLYLRSRRYWRAKSVK